MRLTDAEIKTLSHMKLRNHNKGWWFRVPLYTVDGVEYDECGSYDTKQDADDARRSYARTVTQGVIDGYFEDRWWLESASGAGESVPSGNSRPFPESVPERTSDKCRRDFITAAEESKMVLVTDESGGKSGSMGGDSQEAEIIIQ